MRLTPAQQKLADQARPMVEALARRVLRRLPEATFDELVSLGYEASVEAARTYRGGDVPFPIYAVKHITGAMTRGGAREVFGRLHLQVKRALALELEAPPSDLGLDEALEDTPDKARARALDWARRQAAGAFLSSLAATLDPEPSSSVEEHFIAAEARARGHAGLARALQALDDKERFVVERHYRQGATFDEIATELGVVARTVRRLHDRVKATLLQRLESEGILEPPPLEGGA